ncbi:hypothetical protein M427DRAFT_136057 [Gonapodya prolifera JEL478]|uniref:RRM domain-containing protein n=1 Tax=Gonapodya prolifera (strain JEL478) TaxID=1344416 RepID=A0A139AC07_GONPJ|nr:hypothetical protein M427DRAFT_136057 [Gonapodya prolifera JEL478]|eukprot:KXS13953.1 hypothetical protein M427DRAFT_136057 [Gonapodya prolifera JEL478]
MAVFGREDEEICTLFVVGFPEDIQEREFQNMFIFSPGFEAAALKKPEEEDPVMRRQIIGFVKFRTKQDALEARDILTGRKVDAHRGSTLKADLARKNLHTRRGLTIDYAPSSNYSYATHVQHYAKRYNSPLHVNPAQMRFQYPAGHVPFQPHADRSGAAPRQYALQNQPGSMSPLSQQSYLSEQDLSYPGAFIGKPPSRPPFSPQLPVAAEPPDMHRRGRSFPDLSPILTRSASSGPAPNRDPGGLAALAASHLPSPSSDMGSLSADAVDQFGSYEVHQLRSYRGYGSNLGSQLGHRSFPRSISERDISTIDASQYAPLTPLASLGSSGSGGDRGAPYNARVGGSYRGYGSSSDSLSGYAEYLLERDATRVSSHNGRTLSGSSSADLDSLASAELLSSSVEKLLLESGKLNEGARVGN